MLNTFILVCSYFLENQISLRKITISCNLVHRSGKKRSYNGLARRVVRCLRVLDTWEVHMHSLYV